MNGTMKHIQKALREEPSELKGIELQKRVQEIAVESLKVKEVRK